MFGLLKNKLASFIKGLSGKEEKNEGAAQATPADGEKSIAQPKEAKAGVGKSPAEGKPAAVEEKPIAAEEKKPEAKPGKKFGREEEANKPLREAEKKPDLTERKKTEHKAEKINAHLPVEQKKPASVPVVEVKIAPEPKKEEEKKSLIDSIFGRKMEIKMAPDAQKLHEAKQIPAAPQPPVHKQPEAKPGSKPAAKPFQPAATHPPDAGLARLEKAAISEKKEMAPKIGIGTALKSIFSSEITIGEGEVAGLLSELELSLLEADVAYDVSLEVSSQLRARLVGMKVPKGKMEEKTRQAIQEVLASVMQSDRKFDLVERVKQLEKPVKILFVGPNGAGKTTTMAKIAHMLLNSGMTAVFSASDTFRAAAIEQTEVHAGKLGVKVVKSKYGADPASVAFDAVNFARTHGIDVVLIDSAGRQDTNSNLLDELKKINRVAKPDIKIYIGESIGGNALIDQVGAFDKAIGMDGAILTKIDCDAKGGTALSLAKSTGIPVLYLGVGQAYADLIPFDPGKIAQEIMS
jgi:fused signal recognition particle receptor